MGTETSNSLDKCMQAQHYVNYKSEGKITTNSKMYATKTTSTALTEENIKPAEVIFNYKFRYFDTNDGDENKVDMGAFIKHFSDVKIRNNHELFTFLTETLDWGTDIPFSALG